MVIRSDRIVCSASSFLAHFAKVVIVALRQRRLNARDSRFWPIGQFFSSVFYHSGSLPMFNYFDENATVTPVHIPNLWLFSILIQKELTFLDFTI